MDKKVVPVRFNSTKLMAIFLHSESTCPICEEDLYIGRNKFGKNTVVDYSERYGYECHHNNCKKFKLVELHKITQEKVEARHSEDENEEEEVMDRQSFSNRIFGSKI